MENSPTNFSESLTSEEKMFALLSHLSVIIGGIILPIIFWALQKDKSKFVRFHSLQAIFYHITIACIIFICVFLLVLGIVLSALLLGTSQSNNHDILHPAVFSLSIILFYAVFFIILLANIAYGIYLGVKAYEGRLIKIPIIGNIIYRKVYGNQ